MARSARENFIIMIRCSGVVWRFSESKLEIQETRNVLLGKSKEMCTV